MRGYTMKTQSKIQTVLSENNDLNLLKLPERFTNMLVSGGLSSIECLEKELTEAPDTILAIKGIGPKTLEMIKFAVKNHTDQEVEYKKTDSKSNKTDKKEKKKKKLKEKVKLSPKKKKETKSKKGKTTKKKKAPKRSKNKKKKSKK
jgi:hypothetical protein